MDEEIELEMEVAALYGMIFEERGEYSPRHNATSPPTDHHAATDHRPPTTDHGSTTDHRSKQTLRSYRDLIVWQEGMRLVREVYAVTKEWPREEMFGLTGQARRAAVSIPANIAEGQGRRSSSEFRQHLSIAYGSLMELETHLLIGQDLTYQTQEQTEALLSQSARVGRLINALTQSLPTHRPTQPSPTDHRPPTTDHGHQPPTTGAQRL